MTTFPPPSDALLSQSKLDTSITRITKGDFAFPLGVYPVEECAPTPGYAVQFEAADGADGEADWEEWPDRYVYDIVITADRLPNFARSLFALLPQRIFPILDVLGNDAFREIDPYIAYDLVGFDRFVEELRRHGAWFFEDGMVGFGAMSLEPFLYIFIDEHKVVTIRAEIALRDRVEAVLAAYDVPAIEDPQGADAAAHEHRCVLVTPPEQQDILTPEEITEELLDSWRLRLNIDRSNNVDDEGAELEITAWRCLIRLSSRQGRRLYAEILLTAASLSELDDLVQDEVERHIHQLVSAPSSTLAESNEMDAFEELALIFSDRITPPELEKLLKEMAPMAARAKTAEELLQGSGIHALHWLIDGEPGASE